MSSVHTDKKSQKSYQVTGPIAAIRQGKLLKELEIGASWKVTKDGISQNAPTKYKATRLRACLSTLWISVLALGGRRS